MRKLAGWLPRPAGTENIGSLGIAAQLTKNQRGQTDTSRRKLQKLKSEPSYDRGELIHSGFDREASYLNVLLRSDKPAG
jgi:hypothetical protein